MSPRARRFPFDGGFESILRLRVGSVCVGALSTSRIDKGDGSGFISDVATASLGWFIKIQDYIDSLVLIGIINYIGHERRVRTLRSLARINIYARARVHEAG